MNQLLQLDEIWTDAALSDPSRHGLSRDEWLAQLDGIVSELTSTAVEPVPPPFRSHG